MTDSVRPEPLTEWLTGEFAFLNDKGERESFIAHACELEKVRRAVECLLQREGFEYAMECIDCRDNSFLRNLHDYGDGNARCYEHGVRWAFQAVYPDDKKDKEWCPCCELSRNGNCSCRCHKSAKDEVKKDA